MKYALRKTDLKNAASYKNLRPMARLIAAIAPNDRVLREKTKAGPC
jgi:hypothetical protein